MRFLLIAVLLLAGCAERQPKIVPFYVKVPPYPPCPKVGWPKGPCHVQ